MWNRVQLEQGGHWGDSGFTAHFRLVETWQSRCCWKFFEMMLDKNNIIKCEEILKSMLKFEWEFILIM